MAEFNQGCLQPDDKILQPTNQISSLEYFAAMDQLLIKKKTEYIVCYETQNKYDIKTSLGYKIFYAVEDSDCLIRNCFGSIRPFDMKILDYKKDEIIHLNRPLRIQPCCFPCCLQELEISSPSGSIFGYVQQEWSIFPKFKILNAARDVVLRIKGPICPKIFSCCRDDVFNILSSDGKIKVGKISKVWLLGTELDMERESRLVADPNSGLFKETFTGAFGDIGIVFPINLDVKIKAVLLGACFLLDYMKKF